MLLKYGTPLGAEKERWEVRVPGSALVGVLGEGGRVAYAVALQEGAKAASQLGAANIAKGAAVKVVCGKLFAAPLERIIKAAGLRVEKLVAREDSALAVFVPAEGKLLVGSQPAQAKTRVLVVDDSATIRKLLTKILSDDPEIEIVGDIGNPAEAESAIATTKPDVITLDIHMPGMNGVELLRRYIPRFPIPTVMITSISMEEGPLVLSALEAGAVDYIQKPGAHDLDQAAPLIAAKVKAAKSARVRAPSRKNSPAKSVFGDMDTSRIIAIGSSTGGTEALKDVLLGLPAGIPPILVVQHIPAVFSKALADRLDSLCPFRVVEGRDGEAVEPGKVIIAPGGKQMSLRRQGPNIVIQIDDSAPVNRHKPSVDVLFRSVAKEIGGTAVGVILTGMGADGAEGLLQMRKLGSTTIGQDEATCVVYGMPQAAFKLGAVEIVSPLLQIAGELARICQTRNRGKSA